MAQINITLFHCSSYKKSNRWLCPTLKPCGFFIPKSRVFKNTAMAISKMAQINRTWIPCGEWSLKTRSEKFLSIGVYHHTTKKKMGQLKDMDMMCKSQNLNSVIHQTSKDLILITRWEAILTILGQYVCM